MKWISGLFASILILSTGSAWGQSCQVSTVPVSFGSYNPFFSSPLDATGQVNVTCDSEISFIIRIDQGINSGGSFYPRKLKQIVTGGTLSYNLYRDSARTEIWGDGTGTTLTQTGVWPVNSDGFKIYGRIPVRQNVEVGDYSDRATVIVDW